eukprot:CAMPEP_0177794294 /NCGR_PEP_ID=MMETSP0491_2-20121128/25563_1 /TAXON_ID=63592 /ORGANISM="Tetraselmis chuii, Strain PLY429" /LENGTH=179 /DNA_ID=CAMNT_0019316929 /DNA_START=240 /DNA_END=779 /DNA_ORIENTATION=+
MRETAHAQVPVCLEFLIEHVLIDHLSVTDGSLPVPQQRPNPGGPGAEHEEAGADKVLVLRAHDVVLRQEGGQGGQRVAPPHRVHVRVEYCRADAGTFLDGGQQNARPLGCQLHEAWALVLEALLAVLLPKAYGTQRPVSHARARYESRLKQSHSGLLPHHIHKQPRLELTRPDRRTQVV